MKRVIAVIAAVLMMSVAVAETLPAGEYVIGKDIPALMIYVTSGARLTVAENGVLSIEVDLEQAEIEPTDNTAVAFKAAPGIYVAGRDFPAGVYEICCAEGTSLINLEIKDAKEKRVLSGGFWANKDEKVGRIELLDGYTVKVQDGDAYFAPSTGGIVFE